VAGAAIANSRTYAEAERRQQALTSLQRVANALLSGTGQNEVLRLMASDARDILQADGATVVLASAGRDLRVEVGIGERMVELEGTTVPEAGSIAGQVLRTGEPAHVVETQPTDPVYKPLIDALGGGPAAFVPLLLN